MIEAGAARSRRGRAVRDRLFVGVCLAATAVSVLILGWLLATIVAQGWKHLDWDFVKGFPSRRPENAGFLPAIVGSVLLCSVAAAVALPLGVGAAVFLEEIRPRASWAKRVHAFIQLNISNLAGVPSIVYGVIGLTVFVRCFGLFGSPNLSTYDRFEVLTLKTGERVSGRASSAAEGVIALEHPLRGRIELDASAVQSSRDEYIRRHVFHLSDGRVVRGEWLGAPEPGLVRVLNEDHDEVVFPASNVARYSTVRVPMVGRVDSPWHLRLPLGSSILAGGLTLALVILPIVIISSREALRAVPDSLREAALASGATRLQVVSRMVLPCAVPGIMTGSILSMSRAIGEAAPLLVVGGVLFILFTPRNLMDDFAAMPLQIYHWTSRPQEEFARVAASGIIVLLAVLLSFNAAAILIRQKFHKPLS